MPELEIGNSIIKRKSSTKFLGVMLDENILWINIILKRLKKNYQRYWFIISHKTIS